MARRPRNEEAGAIHHVFAHAVEGDWLFRDEDDHLEYLALLRTATRRYEWRTLSYCLMGNHVHLLVETPQPNLGEGMWLAHGAYARTFNERHGRRGHLFRERYGAKRMESTGQLWTAAAYVAANPVAAGLCTEPEAWRWSSYAARPSWTDHARLEHWFTALGGIGAERYAAAVTERSAEALAALSGSAA